MAKLIALVLAFSAFLALATAHTTIVTTTIEDENPISSQQQQCRRQLQGESFNQCRMHLIQQSQSRGSPYDEFRQQQGQQGQMKQILDQCCQELENVEEDCQCEAVKQVFRDAQRQVQQQHGQQGVPRQLQSQQLKQEAQRLPNQCNLQIRRQCSIGSITTTMTTTDDSNFDFPIPFWPKGSKGSEQCSQSQIQRPVNQCQRYVEEQMFSYPRTLLMSINRRGQQQDPELTECCDELQNLNKDCQCEAIEELARRMIRQPQQQRGQQQQQMQTARRVIRNLPTQCNIDVQQCNVPY